MRSWKAWIVALGLGAGCSMGGQGTRFDLAVRGDGGDPRPDGGRAVPDFSGIDGAPGPCAELEACCPSLSMEFQSDCYGTAETRNDPNCASFLQFLRMNGSCRPE